MKRMVSMIFQVIGIIAMVVIVAIVITIMIATICSTIQETAKARALEKQHLPLTRLDNIDEHIRTLIGSVAILKNSVEDTQDKLYEHDSQLENIWIELAKGVDGIREDDLQDGE
jgi:uncharacterized protein YlxW (UPF0749 family)